MIVGHGNVARVIPKRLDYPDLIYFASGVSDSAEFRASEFLRELRLLQMQPRREHLVYFSSLCVFYSETPYAYHKREMERVVSQTFPSYTIMRLGNLEWDDNPKTLINTLRARHAAGLPLDIQNVDRYVCSLDEFHHWLALIPRWSCEMNVPGRRMTVQEIVNEYVLGERVTA